MDDNEIDDFLNKIKKIMESEDFDAIPGINEEQKEHLKMFLEDFDELKDEIKDEIHKLNPFTKQMVDMVNENLQNLPNNNPQANTPSPETPQTNTNTEKQLTDIPGTTENLETRIAAIDEKLRQPNLSDDDINRLLDQRTAIAEELNAK